ncbi:hypothetical protein J6590_021044 [Homalodisca vitripennis]|nr:hypothetical protein J6590_021044 [Homalodisca vitripennis]
MTDSEDRTSWPTRPMTLAGGERGTASPEYKECRSRRPVSLCACDSSRTSCAHSLISLSYFYPSSEGISQRTESKLVTGPELMVAVPMGNETV